MRTFTSWALFLTGGLALWLASEPGAYAQTNEPVSVATFRTDVTEVRMTFSTTDGNDRAIGTVQPRDFAIVDQNMVVRDFRSFARSEYTKLEVAMLVDASGSVTRQLRPEVAHAVEIIAAASGVPEQSFSIVSFRDTKPAVVCEANCRDLMNADTEFPAIQSGGMTPLYDSVVFAARRFGRDATADDSHTRKILIVLSDGDDTISLNSYQDALDAAVANDVAVYSVDVNGRPHNARGMMTLRALSANTGGRYFPIEAGTEKVVDAILEDFHTTYTVAYKLPTRAAGFHQVRILPTHNLALQFHCRHGYYYPSN